MRREVMVNFGRGKALIIKATETTRIIDGITVTAMKFENDIIIHPGDSVTIRNVTEGDTN